MENLTLTLIGIAPRKRALRARARALPGGRRADFQHGLDFAEFPVASATPARHSSLAGACARVECMMPRMRIGPAGLLILLLGVTACARTPDAVRAAPSPDRDSWQTCAVDADCVLLTTSCCWQCNKVYAIAIAHRDEARARYEPVCTSDDICNDLEVGCQAATPICRDQVCGYRMGQDFFPKLPPR